MEAFVNFIKEYWQFISFGFLLALEVLLIFLKSKKPAVISDGILDLIEGLVKQAEEKFGSGNGNIKLDYVVNNVQRSFPTASREAIIKHVEFLLTLPQKKGGTR